MVLIFLTLPWPCYTFLLPLCGSVLLEIIVSPHKNRLICGTEMRLKIRLMDYQVLGPAKNKISEIFSSCFLLLDETKDFH